MKREKNFAERKTSLWKAAALLLICMLTLFTAGCGQTDEDKDAEQAQTEVTIFAAASMTEALNQLGDAYMAEHENVKLVFNFDSSGTLQTQIEEGATCDIFISAAQAQMDALGELAEDSRFDILENQVVLVVPEGNPAKINSYDDLKKGLSDGSVFMAMGNSDVPVGQYTQKILAYMGLDETALAESGRITYGGNVKEVTTQVSEAMADCGVIYATDAYTAGLKIVDTANAEMCGQVIYPAAVLKTSANQAEAEAFLSWLTGEEAGSVFEDYGFTPVK